MLAKAVMIIVVCTTHAAILTTEPNKDKLDIEHAETIQDENKNHNLKAVDDAEKEQAENPTQFEKLENAYFDTEVFLTNSDEVLSKFKVIIEDGKDGAEEPSRVKREEDVVVWDSCPDKTHFEFINDHLRCVTDDGMQIELDNRYNFGSLKCPDGQKSIIFQGKRMCIRSSKRKKLRMA